MTKYREIIRLSGLGLSQTNIALSCNASKTTALRKILCKRYSTESENDAKLDT